MSLFQPVETLQENKNTADTFHLDPHGCNVMFTRYEKGTNTDTLINLIDAKHRLISGAIDLTINGKTKKIHAGEWYRIPSNTEHSLFYTCACSVIEFWFDRTNSDNTTPPLTKTEKIGLARS